MNRLPHDLSHIEALTIDAMGILITPSPSIGAIYAKVLEENDAQLPEDGQLLIQTTYDRVYQKHLKHRLMEGIHNKNEKAWWLALIQEVIQQIVPHHPTAQLKTWAKLCWEAFGQPANWDEVPGSRPPLEALSRFDYRLNVFTSFDERANKVFKGLGFNSFLEDIFSATSLGYRKPHPAAFLSVQDALGLNKHEILHLTNKAEDAQAAIKAGWQVAYVGPKDEHLSQALNLSHVGELLDYLLKKD